MSFDIRFRTYTLTPEQEEEFKDEMARVKGSFEKNYQSWYTEAHALIKQLVPAPSDRIHSPLSWGRKT
jgi:hypothetical protein